MNLVKVIFLLRSVMLFASDYSILPIFKTFSRNQEILKELIIETSDMPINVIYRYGKRNVMEGKVYVEELSED